MSEADLIARVTAEMAHAERTYGGYTSTHEAIGVLAEGLCPGNAACP